jgi:hypothetical protein
MIALLRVVALLGLGSVGFCALAWLFTRDRAWLRRGLLALKVSVAVAVVFFGVVILERMQA